jgi:hypothetical protein
MNEMPSSLLRIWENVTVLEADDSIATTLIPSYQDLFVKGFRNTILSRIKANMNEYNIFGMTRLTYLLCINMHE